MLAQKKRRTHSAKSGVLAFTLIELLVVISIISLLIAILLPVLSKARDSAQSVICLSNLRQTGIVAQMYVNDSKGFLHPSYTSGGPDWFTYLAPYDDTFTREVGRKSMWSCPSQPLYWSAAISNKQNGNYAMSDSYFKVYIRQDSIKHLSTTVLYLDSYKRGTDPKVWTHYTLFQFKNPTFNGNGADYYYHNGSANLLFVGGNASSASVETGQAMYVTWMDVPTP